MPGVLDGGVMAVVFKCQGPAKPARRVMMMGLRIGLDCP